MNMKYPYRNFWTHKSRTNESENGAWAQERWSCACSDSPQWWEGDWDPPTSEDSDWLVSKFSVGGFFSMCLASRKHLLGNAGTWGIEHVTLFYKQAMNWDCSPLYFCGCLLFGACHLFIGWIQVFFWVPHTLILCHQIGYIISPEVGSSFKWESSLSFSFFSSFSSLPLQFLCIKSSTVGVPHQVAWILYIENAVASEHLIYLYLLELGSAKGSNSFLCKCKSRVTPLRTGVLPAKEIETKVSCCIHSSPLSFCSSSIHCPASFSVTYYCL